MAKFLNKKEQVYDLKLTSYGHYLMSIGIFEPVYYAFFDDNILYDSSYAYEDNSGNTYTNRKEGQNEIDLRIKKQTQYLESFVLFKEVDTNEDTSIFDDGYYKSDVTAIEQTPRIDMFKFDSMIGDAHLDAAAHTAPAWKIISLQNEINKSSVTDTLSDSNIPQIDIVAKYTKRIVDRTVDINPTSVRGLMDSTPAFGDDKMIQLEIKDVLVYAEEVNTELLTENFDVEVFAVTKTTATHASASIAALKTPSDGDFISIATTQANYTRDHYYNYVFKTSPGADTANSRFVEIDGALGSLNNLYEKIQSTLADEDASIDKSYTVSAGGFKVILMNTISGVKGNFSIKASTDVAGTFNIDGFKGARDQTETLERKYFDTVIPQVVDGFMVSPNKSEIDYTELTTGSVEYYFDILTDTQIEPSVACMGASEFNKKSYYIDLDFDCESVEAQNVSYYDIYGPVTEPEPCQD